jgi:hypothetical protein
VFVECRDRGGGDGPQAIMRQDRRTFGGVILRGAS